MSKEWVLPSRDDQTAAHGDILHQWAIVESMRHDVPVSIKYSREEFQRHFGRPYFMDEKTFSGKQGKQKACYLNAGRMALDLGAPYQYVEGVMSMHGILIDHAWVVVDDRIIDPTVRPHPGITGYWGVPYRQDYLRETILEHKVWGVFGWPNVKNLLTGAHDGKFLAEMKYA